jgi:hypothetical protein
VNSYWLEIDRRHQTYVEQPGAGAPPPHRVTVVPPYNDVAAHLPELHWPAQPEVEAASTLAWRLTWDHLHAGRPDGAVAAPFVDAAFNGCVFLWDAVFTARLTTYARRVLEIDTLGNFYALQQPDGWICRTVTPDGAQKWDRHDPCSTGPNVVAWAEQMITARTGDVERLDRIFPALLAYHRWTRRYRTWPDGGYWSTGWGCGMDGLPRLPADADPNFEHGWTTWVDATLQALLSARVLVQMAESLGRPEPVRDLLDEIERLEAFATDRLWDEEVGAFTDRWPGGVSAGVLHVGAYWALLAEAGTDGQRARLVAHLTDPTTLGRPFPVPALSAGADGYREDGGYWRGGVWTPTTLAVLDGLDHLGQGDLAHRLAREHVLLVARTARDTGTLWENYSPERPVPGFEARPDFCGWTGASAFTAPLEYVFGIVPQGSGVRWDVRLLDEHGISRLPVGAQATVDLRCAARADEMSTPQITGRSDAPVVVDVSWAGGAMRLLVTPDGTTEEVAVRGLG